MLIVNVVGVRPNFMKIAPVVHEQRRRGLVQRLVHTGQHYDAEMSAVFSTNSGFLNPIFTSASVRIPMRDRPHVSLLHNTERPVTVTDGTNRLVGTDPQVIGGTVDEVLDASPQAPAPPPHWDGQAAVRLMDVVERWMADQVAFASASTDSTHE